MVQEQGLVQGLVQELVQGLVLRHHQHKNYRQLCLVQCHLDGHHNLQERSLSHQQAEDEKGRRQWLGQWLAAVRIHERSRSCVEEVKAAVLWRLRAAVGR